MPSQPQRVEAFRAEVDPSIRSLMHTGIIPAAAPSTRHIMEEPPSAPDPERRTCTPEAGKYYRCRDMKRKVYVVGKSEDPNLFVCASNGSYQQYREDGTCFNSSNPKNDLVMEWKELQLVQLMGHQNVYSDHSVSPVYTTKQEANQNVDPSKTRIACIDIARQVYEGQGLFD